MKKILAFAFPSLLILGALVTKKGNYLEAVSDKPTVLEATLLDSMPEKAVHALGAEDVRGVKVNYPNGSYASYFNYEANGAEVLHAIAYLPFPLYAVRADMVCRRLDIAELEIMKNKISDVEKKEATFFWSADLAEYNLYESLKPPFKHTVLVHKKTNQILHRIELIG